MNSTSDHYCNYHKLTIILKESITYIYTHFNSYIEIWEDIYMNTKSRLFKPTTLKKPNPYLVKDLMLENREWSMPLIQNIFWEVDVNTISSIHISLNQFLIN